MHLICTTANHCKPLGLALPDARRAFDTMDSLIVDKSPQSVVMNLRVAIAAMLAIAEKVATRSRRIPLSDRFSNRDRFPHSV